MERQGPVSATTDRPCLLYPWLPTASRAVRRAVQLRRLKMPTGTTVSDVINQILREALAEELAEVATFPGMESEEGYKPKKRGRPSKRKEGE